jgi:hypothetical protein
MEVAAALTGRAAFEQIRPWADIYARVRDRPLGLEP